MAEDRILLALSGGVDSAVAARILQQQGFEVEAAVICFSPAHRPAVAAAQTAAKELGIPLSVLHCEERFEEKVVQPFCTAYAEGRTPNPCVWCNPEVKFHVLWEEAQNRGIQYITSGHYARMEERNGIQTIAQAASPQRDQSYMLYRLPRSLRDRLCLPLGEFEKADIRDMARDFGLSCSEAPDSQEICFIPEGGYADFLLERGIQSKPGHFIGPEGQDLGPHKGVLHYTAGQRRGLGLALGQPVFVKSILPEGDVKLAYAGDEYANAIHIDDIVTSADAPLNPELQYHVKIRSMAKPVPCYITNQPDGTIHIAFQAPQRAPAPGQHAVLYDGPYIAGGGVIRNVFDTN